MEDQYYDETTGNYSLEVEKQRQRILYFMMQGRYQQPEVFESLADQLEANFRTLAPKNEVNDLDELTALLEADPKYFNIGLCC